MNQRFISVYLSRLLSPMESLNSFESEMEADGQGSYSLFPALDSIASLSGTPETLERLLKLSLHCHRHCVRFNTITEITGFYNKRDEQCVNMDIYMSICRQWVHFGTEGK